MLIKRILLALSVLLNLTLIVYLLVSDNGLSNYQTLKADTYAFTQRQDMLDEKAYLLSHEIRLLQNDSEYVEKIIRARLGFVKSNEILYIFPDSKIKIPVGARE
ncbi:septum formation initiator family protein [Halodesulfovibrio sp. MK-HDV]|jgi:cell division protein FtsB|uniref:FtsB family cell division protein n=1 Tax=unclassified Halodesulfovibrio TaxID=2644657 RepID=UPI00136EA23C|nr:septum formation initiator family protein [Halodesulfovibrio sp. MK-HDV]KAF1077765.1 Cell division protein FtsB [Halodesulfovibrio sp. MK-HDV]